MRSACRLGPGRLLTLLVAFLLSNLPMSVTTASAPSAQLDAASPAIDLAAMTLTPADLDVAGLPGFGFDFGYFTYQEDLIGFVAERRGLSVEEAGALIEGSGYQRWYESYLYLPVDASDSRGDLSTTFSSYIIEFADPQGSAAAWSWMEDDSSDPTAEDVPLTTILGDQAEATRYSGKDESTGRTFSALDLTVRVGNLHIGVRVLVWVGVEPDLDTAQGLVARLMERVSTTQQGGAPGLSAQSLRLTGDGVQPSLDGYVLLDGKATRLLGESDADTLDRASSAASHSMTDIYRVWQSIPTGSLQPEGAVWYFLEIERFSDVTAAASWLDGQVERLATNPTFTDLKIDSSAPTFGDQSVTYSAKSADFDVAYRSVALRVGSTVAVIDVEGPGTPPAEAVVALAEAQVSCLGAGGCVDPLPVPPSLSGYIAGLKPTGQVARETPTAEATPVTGETPDPGGTPSPLGQYRSPTWGFSVAWDPADWVVVDASRDDGLELHLNGSVLVIAKVDAVEDYGGDPQACLQALAEPDSDTPLVPSARYVAPETVDGAVGGVYELGDFGVMYFECRPLVPGKSVLQVRIGAPSVDYESALPAFEALLAHISVGGG